MKTSDLLIWGVVYSLLSLGIVVTNAFAIFIFTQRRFKRKRSQYLLINLAVTDFLVGAIALPIYIKISSHCETSLHETYLTADIIAGMASVSTVTLISLERLLVVGWPWRNRLLTRRHYFLAVTSTWLYGILIRVLLIISFHLKFVKDEFLYLFISCLGIPFAVTLISCMLTIVMKKRSDKSLKRLQRSISQQNTRLVQSMLIVIIVFWITWLPFYICNLYPITDHWCEQLNVKLLKLLHYSNSLINPIIYSLRLPPFRSTLRKMFCRSQIEQEDLRLRNPELVLHIPSKKQKT